MTDGIVPRETEIIDVSEPASSNGTSSDNTTYDNGGSTQEVHTDFGKGRTRSSMNGIDSAIKCMISFFTIIRLDVGQAEFDAMERKFWLSPVLGFINGLVAMIVCLLLGLFGASMFVQAVAAIASMYIFSKFLHFDGLTDFGDGMIVSSGKREDHIRALKDSLIGAGGFGVALIVVLMTIAFYNDVGSYLLVVDNGKILSIGLAALGIEILVKNAQVAAAAFGEPGNGMASRQVRYTTVDSLIRSVLLTIILLGIAAGITYGIACLCDYRVAIGLGRGIVVFVMSILTSVVVGYFMARTANKTFGFVNGDILGATNEISRCIILLITLMILGVW